MKKIFKLKNGYVVNTFYVVLPVMFGFFLFTSGQTLDWANPLLYIGLIIIVFVFFLMSNRGVVEINNGVLSRQFAF